MLLIAFWYLFVDPLMQHQQRLHSEEQPSESEAEELEEQPAAGWKAAEVSVETFRSALVQVYTSIKDSTQDKAKAAKMAVKLRQVDVMLENYQRRHPGTWRTVVCKLVRKLHSVCPSVYFDSDLATDDDDRSFLDNGNGLPQTEDASGTPDSGHKLFRTKSNKVVLSSQHKDYQHRGKPFENYTPWEYAALVQLKEMPEEVNTKEEEYPPVFADLANGEEHPLKETHMQKPRTKSLVPMLASKKTPPPFPGPQPSDRTSDAYAKWLNKAGAAARYYGAVFVPHSIKTGKAPCQGANKEEAWNQFVTIMQSYHEATSDTNKDYKMLKARFATIYNIAHCQRSSMNMNMLSRTHRSRFADSLKHVKGKEKDADEDASNAATQDYMDGLVASMQRGQDVTMQRLEEKLDELFPSYVVEAQDDTTEPVVVNSFLPDNLLNIKQADANIKIWKDRGKDYAELPASTEGVLGSASNRHGTETVKKAVVKFLEYVVSEDMGHGFPDGDLETGVLASTVNRLVMGAKNNKEQWLDTCKCWQDDVVDQLKRMLVNQDQDQLNQDQLNQDQDQIEDTVHGFLEGLSLDQLQPYLDAVATVRNGEPLNLLIHAPPGCGKT